jgi:hypothetical protein
MAWRPLERILADRTAAAARLTLGDAPYEAAFASGQAAAWEAVLEEGLA